MAENKVVVHIFDAVTLAAERTSGWLNCMDIETVVVAYNFGGAGAATNVFLRVDWYLNEQDAENKTAARTFVMNGSGGVVLSGTDGVETFEPWKGLRTSGSADIGTLSFAAQMPFCRIRIDGASGDASDIVSAWAILIKAK
jgi:hypothetical protein